MAVAQGRQSPYVHTMATAHASRPSSVMTARVVVMMTPAEKRALEERAGLFELTPSELIRRAAAKYEPEMEEAALEFLAHEIEQNTVEMRRMLTTLNDSVEATITEMRILRAAHMAR